MTNDGYYGDAYKPALMTMAEISVLYGVKASRIRSARKHMSKHPEPVVKVRKTDYFHTHSIYEYMANGNPLEDLRAVELKMRRGYLSNVKKHSKQRAVRNAPARNVPMQSFNVAKAW